MTVAAGAAKAGPYTGNDSASSFAFSFKVFADADIRVIETVIATEAETDLVLNTNYTVTRNNDQDNNPGGTITYKVGGVTTALPSTKKLTIVGDFDYAQPTDIPNGGAFFAQVVENALDRITLLTKQIKEKLDRAAVVPVSSTYTVEDLSDDLIALAAIETEITTVAAIDTDITTVANIAANVTTVAGIAGDVSAVAAIGTDVSAVASLDPADIEAVADNVTDITNFADVYQGAHATDPTLRNNGDPLQAGDLYFNTVEEALRVYSGTVWVAGTAGTISVQTFSGDGVETEFALAAAPASENNTQVYIGPAYQQKSEYSISGTTLTFTDPPPAGTDNIEVVTVTTLALGETVANLVSYTPAGAGAVERTVEGKLRESVSIKDFGAVGDGTTDDTAAIQAALTAGVRVYVPPGTYKVTGALSVSSSAGAPRSLILHGDSTASVIAFSGGGYLSLSKSNYTSDFVLRDLSFTSDGNAATKVVFNVARGEVRNCTFNGFVLGLEVNQAYQLIQHNTFISCTTGIKNIDRASVPGSYYNANAISNNFFASCGTGVALQHTTAAGGVGSTVITPVYLHQNTFEGCSTAGIRLSWASGVTIDCGYFENTPINIYADNFTQSLMVQNVLSHPTEITIKLDDSHASVFGGRCKNFALTNASTLRQIAPFGGALEGTSVDATSRYTTLETEVAYTPTITGSGVAGTTTYSVQVGRYVRQGSLVHVTFNVGYTATTGSGDLLISLPFPVRTQANFRAVGTVQPSGYNLSAAAGSLTLFAASGGSAAAIYLSSDDLSAAAQPLTNETATFVGSITYITDAA